MKRVCAWCGRMLDEAACQEGVDVTHGLCKECRAEFFASAKSRATASPCAVSGGVGEAKGKDPDSPVER